MPYSLYFNRAKWTEERLNQYVTQLNEERLNDAWSYLNHLNHYKQQNNLGFYNYSKNNTDIAIGVLTVPRHLKGERIGYLTQTVSQFLKLEMIEGISGFEEKVFFLCDAHKGPGRHNEADQLGLFVKHYKITEIKLNQDDKFEKEKNDYIYCLQKALEFSPKYVLVLEDDVLPNPNFYRIIKSQIQYYFESHPNGDNLGYIKLYNPEKWLGYSWSVQHILEMLSFGGLGGLVFSLVKGLFSRRRHNVNTLLNPCFLHGACYFILLVYCIGRQHILQIRAAFTHLYMVERNPACCTQGVIYNIPRVKSLISFLLNTTCTESYAVDSAIDKYMDSNKYERLLIQPNLLSHIGIVSTVRQWSKMLEHFI